MDPFFLMIRRGPLTEMGTRLSNRVDFRYPLRYAKIPDRISPKDLPFTLRVRLPVRFATPYHEFIDQCVVK